MPYKKIADKTCEKIGVDEYDKENPAHFHDYNLAELDMQSGSKNKFIDDVKKILENRQKKYGSPKENFSMIAEKWSKTLCTKVTEKQVGLMMLDFKFVRLLNGEDCYDTLLDICGYCECISRL